eukprot:jgi/Galph1/1625/GphlegSOOS_G325.1
MASNAESSRGSKSAKGSQSPGSPQESSQVNSSSRTVGSGKEPFTALPSGSPSPIPYLRSFLIVIVAILATTVFTRFHSKSIHREHIGESNVCKDFSTPSFSFILRSSRVVTENGTKPASVFVTGEGIISRVVPGLVEDQSWGCLHDVGDLVVMPGLIDPHVHVNEPGTDSEGFDTATLAAAAGGTTMIFDMPLNSHPACTSLETLVEKRKVAAMRRLWVDVGLIGGMIPGNLDTINNQIFHGGVVALKSFTIDSQAFDFPPVTLFDVEQVMLVLKNLSLSENIKYMIHAELAPSDFSITGYGGADTSYMAFMRSRPDSFEVNAVKGLIEAVRKTGNPIYIVHVSSADAAELIKEAKKEGLPVYAETCTQYLAFTADDIPDGHPEYKCVPPIRPGGNRKRLLRYLLEDRLFDTIASDHAPATPEQKHFHDGNIREAYAGISGLQYRLQAVWTALKPYGVKFEDLAYWMSESPAKVFQMNDRKGRIASGLEADFVVWDPDSFFNVTSEYCYYRHKMSAFLGKQFFGEVKETFLRGSRIYKSDAYPGRSAETVLHPRGKLVTNRLVR